MRSLAIIALVPFLFLTSCLEEFEPDSSSFVRVFGENLESNPYGMLLEEDGILIYGSVSKSVQASSFQSSDDIPFLIKTDFEGNEILSKQYKLSGLKALYRPDIIFPDSIYNIKHGNFRDIIKLNNGHYFAIIRYCLDVGLYECNQDTGREPLYAILDQDFNIIKLRWFNDREKLAPFNQPLRRHNRQNNLYKIPGSNDIIVLSRLSSEVLPNDNSNRTHALNRLTQEGEFVWSQVYYESLPKRSWGNDLDFNQAGNIVVVCNDYDPSDECSQVGIEVIDIENGDLIERIVLGNENSKQIPISLRKTMDGFIVQEMFTLTSDCLPLNSNIPDPTREFNGEVRFLDQNLSFLRSKIVTNSTLFDWASMMISTSDGGYVMSYLTGPNGEQRAGSVVLKLDESGEVEWSFDYKNYVLRGRKTIIEMNDGSILILGLKEFNTNGLKWVLIKLTPDGKL